MNALRQDIRVDDPDRASERFDAGVLIGAALARTRSGRRRTGGRAAQRLMATSGTPMARLLSWRALATFRPNTYCRSWPKVALPRSSVHSVFTRPSVSRTRFFATGGRPRPPGLDFDFRLAMTILAMRCGNSCTLYSTAPWALKRCAPARRRNPPRRLTYRDRRRADGKPFGDVAGATELQLSSKINRWDNEGGKIHPSKTLHNHRECPTCDPNRRCNFSPRPVSPAARLCLFPCRAEGRLCLLACVSVAVIAQRRPHDERTASTSNPAPRLKMRPTRRPLPSITSKSCRRSFKASASL